MEEKDLVKKNSEAEEVGSSTQDIQHEPTVKKDRTTKILIIASVVFMSLLLIFILSAPILIAKINPIGKFNEAKIANCEDKFKGNQEKINSCFKENKIIMSVTPSPSPVPAITVAPTVNPTSSAKVTVAQKATPTPTGNPTLVIHAGKGVTNVTLTNQSTGKTFSEAIASPGKNYYVEPGAYRITFNEVAECRPAYSVCYGSCGFNSGSWGWDETGSTANVNVEAGKTNGVSIFQSDPNSPTKNPYTVCPKFK